MTERQDAIIASYMKYLAIFVLTVVVIVQATPIVASEEATFNPSFLLSDEDMTDTDSLSLTDISRFLTRGGLSGYSDTDIDGVERDAGRPTRR